MEYIQGLSYQTRLFAYFFAFGFLLGTLYDAILLLRVMFVQPRKNVFMLDAVFGSIAAFVTFVCLLALNHGQVQVFLLLGEGLGALVYILSLGAAAAELREALFKVKRKTINTAARPAKFLYGKIKELFGKIIAAIRNFLKKTWDSLKIRLHSEHNLRYNNSVESEAESRTSGGKAKGRASCAKIKKSRRAKTSQKTAQSSAGAGGGAIRLPVRISDDNAHNRGGRAEKANHRKAKRNSRNPKGERKV